MGLFDNILKNAAKSIDNAIGDGSHQFTDLANKAFDAKNEAIYGKSENSGNEKNKVENKAENKAENKYNDTTPFAPSRKVEGEAYYNNDKTKVSFSVSSDFVYQESDESFPISLIYKPGGEDYKDYGVSKDNINLYFSTNLEVGLIVEEYKTKKTISDSWNLVSLDGKYLFKANKKYFNKIIYIYGFDNGIEGGENNALIVEYPPEVKNTELEKKLMSALDEVADTFIENK